MNRISSISGPVMLAAMAAPAGAHVIVSVEPAAQVVNRGDTFAVEIRADFTSPVVGWGLDFTVSDTAIAITAPPPVIGPIWFGLNAADGDDLAALAFPTPVVGADVLLVTIQMQALHVGQADLSISATEGDLTEGFALQEQGQFDTVTFVPGSVLVIPAPAGWAWIIVLALSRRRRM